MVISLDTHLCFPRNHTVSNTSHATIQNANQWNVSILPCLYLILYVLNFIIFYSLTRDFFFFFVVVVIYLPTQSTDCVLLKSNHAISCICRLKNENIFEWQINTGKREGIWRVAVESAIFLNRDIFFQATGNQNYDC